MEEPSGFGSLEWNGFTRVYPFDSSCLFDRVIQTSGDSAFGHHSLVSPITEGRYVVLRISGRFTRRSAFALLCDRTLANKAGDPAEQAQMRQVVPGREDKQAGDQRQ